MGFLHVRIEAGVPYIDGAMDGTELILITRVVTNGSRRTDHTYTTERNRNASSGCISYFFKTMALCVNFGHNASRILCCPVNFSHWLFYLLCLSWVSALDCCIPTAC